jgi:S1-C subfamily serine protease
MPHGARVVLPLDSARSGRHAPCCLWRGGIYADEDGDVTVSIARQLGLPAGVDGAVVYDVAGDSAADRAGRRQGDITRSVNRQQIHTASDAVRELRRIAAGASVLLLIWRDENELLLQMRRE